MKNFTKFLGFPFFVYLAIIINCTTLGKFSVNKEIGS